MKMEAIGVGPDGCPVFPISDDGALSDDLHYQSHTDPYGGSTMYTQPSSTTEPMWSQGATMQSGPGIKSSHFKQHEPTQHNAGNDMPHPASMPSLVCLLC